MSAFVSPSTPPASPSRSFAIVNAPYSPTHDPFAGTSKASPGCHPAFSKEHYSSPSHLDKRRQAETLGMSQPSIVSPRHFERSVSAPAAMGSPQRVLEASKGLQSVMEADDKGKGRATPDALSEEFNLELAGMKRADRERWKSERQLLFDRPQKPHPNLTNDDDCDWLPGQVDGPVNLADFSRRLVFVPDTISVPPTSPSFVSPPASILSASATLSSALAEFPYVRELSPSKLGSHEALQENAEQLFEEAFDDAVVQGHRTIDLTRCGIKAIPPSISDLAHTPAWAPSVPRGVARHVSMPRSIFGLPLNNPSARLRAKSRDEYQGFKLILVCNPICTLPLELFSISNLRVLSLRGCRLVEVPPAIGRLPNLVELDLSQNQLTWLPAEILLLAADATLHIGANKWLSRPQESTLGPLIHVSDRGIPKLAELCMRKLLQVPREELTASHFRNVARYGARILAKHYKLDVGACPCGERTRDAGAECPCRPFFDHAEERMEWTKVAGELVPLKWRGCRRGCLAWLESITD